MIPLIDGGTRPWNRASLVNGRVIFQSLVFPSPIVTHDKSDGEGCFNGHASSGVVASMRQKVVVLRRTAVTHSAADSEGEGWTDLASLALNKAIVRY